MQDHVQESPGQGGLQEYLLVCLPITSAYQKSEAQVQRTGPVLGALFSLLFGPSFVFGLLLPGPVLGSASCFLLLCASRCLLCLSTLLAFCFFALKAYCLLLLCASCCLLLCASRCCAFCCLFPFCFLPWLSAFGLAFCLCLAPKILQP